MGGQTQKCKKCWEKADVDDWENWPARFSYKKSSIEGRKSDVPFIQNQVDTHCD